MYHQNFMRDLHYILKTVQIISLYIKNKKVSIKMDLYPWEHKKGLVLYIVAPKDTINIQIICNPGHSHYKNIFSEILICIFDILMEGFVNVI